MTDAINTREIILDLLTEILEKESYSHIMLNQALFKYQYLSRQERAFISRVTQGTVEYCLQIDEILNQISKVPVARMKPVIRNILRMSVYQICHMDGVPDRAACDEAVKLVKKRRLHGLHGFVNGVLRTVIRQKETGFKPAADDLRSRLSFDYSMPGWIVEDLLSQYGEEQTKEILAAFLKADGLTLRCNLSRASKGAIVASLKADGAEVWPDEHLDYVLHIKNFDYLERLSAFRKGYVCVQDLSSCYVGEAARILAPEGGLCIDVCSAPGGKALHLADILAGKGQVEARDVSEKKVLLIEEGINRCGFNNITAKVMDALSEDEASIGKADILLADLPCSGLGVIGKKPDIKYRMTKSDRESLTQLQRRLLSQVQAYVKPGGLLIYSTCTISREENQNNRGWFLENFQKFHPVSLKAVFGTDFSEESLENGYLQLLPGVHKMDGFFIAAMRKSV